MNRCANCGFLSLRNPQNGTLEEVELKARKTGHFRAFDVTAGKMIMERAGPLCFVMAFELADEVQQRAHELQTAGPPATDGYGHPIVKDPNAPIVLEVITKDRPCEFFVTWLQGYSPKEHSDVKILQEQRERDHKWQEDRRKEDLNWRAEQDQKAEDRWKADSQKAEDRWKAESRHNRYQLVVVGIIGTFILAAAQICGSLIQAGLVFPPPKEQPVININIPAGKLGQPKP